MLVVVLRPETRRFAFRQASRMKKIQRSLRLSISALLLLSNPNLISRLIAQTPPQPPPTLEQQENQSYPHPQVPTAQLNQPSTAHLVTYRDMDLLRRSGFANADQATVIVRVFDKAGTILSNLQPSDFELVVNGTPRTFRLHAPGADTTSVPPVVLLVFPPNDPIVHYNAAKQAIKYFSELPGEQLPWKVGIFDSNAKLIPFTGSQSQLLATLNQLQHTIEPFQFTTAIGMSANARWDGSWLSKAEEAIGFMQHYDGPKVVLAMNPSAISLYGGNDFDLAHNGPESLRAAAEHVGAHIYVDNVIGPEVDVPGGEAAENQGAFAPRLGSSPSQHMQVDPVEIARLNYYAYLNSQMMQTAAATQGGFANSLKALAAQIHHNLDKNFQLDFQLTPQDQDRGIPDVEIKLAHHELRLALLDVIPLNHDPGSIGPEKLAALLKEAGSQHLSSPDFRIAQHVDYFPTRDGLEPILPMSAAVEWTGPGHPPEHLYIAELVEDENLATPVLQRELQIDWKGQIVTWERDGHLTPGHYAWRVGIYDGTGKILSAAEEKIEIAFPHSEPINASSLIIGKTCETNPPSTGLQHRSPENAARRTTLNSIIDPMRAANCRIVLDATRRFAPSDTLHAFVRIYPGKKLDRHPPESWTATFVLRFNSGAIEFQKEIHFAVDSGSGYLASMELPLNAPSISPGAHTLNVLIQGPGIHSDLKKSQQLFIESR
jgi:hypothetical protein